MKYRTAVIQLPLVREAAQDIVVRTPEDVYQLCQDIADLAQEAFHVLLLSTKNLLIDRQMVSLGVADASLAHPREVFRLAIGQLTTSAVILAHNHPSSDPTPSAEDIRITRQMIEAGKILDIKVLDHVVIGRHRGMNKPYLSMREAGICDFS